MIKNILILLKKLLQKKRPVLYTASQLERIKEVLEEREEAKALFNEEIIAVLKKRKNMVFGLKKNCLSLMEVKQGFRQFLLKRIKEFSFTKKKRKFSKRLF